MADLYICSMSEWCDYPVCDHKQVHEHNDSCDRVCGKHDEIARCFEYQPFGEVDIVD